MSADLVTFPAPEAEVVRVLRSAGFPAATKVPQQIPNPFVHVLSTGGSGRSLALTQRTILLFCYASTEVLAARFCERVVANLVAAGRDPQDSTIRDFVVAGEPAFNPDPDITMPRYSATVALTMRGTPSS